MQGLEGCMEREKSGLLEGNPWSGLFELFFKSLKTFDLQGKKGSADYFLSL
jgi:hypothetical protein